MTKFLSIAVGAALLFTACADTGGNETIFENGDRLVIHNNVSGAAAQTGELVKFHVTVANGDSVLQSTRTALPAGERVVLPPIDTSAEPNTFLEAFRYLSEGDSATLYTLLDSTTQLPPWVDRAAGISYGINVIGVGDTLAAAAYQDSLEGLRSQAMAARAVYTERRAAVQDSVETLLNEYRRRGANRAGYTTTASGLMYKILEPGSGTQPQQGQSVLVSYYGALSENGDSFDDSFKRGQGIDFPLGVGQVIPGWDEGIALLQPGARAMLIIPSEIGYGERGSGPNIPPNSELAFYVQLDDVK